MIRHSSKISKKFATLNNEYCLVGPGIIEIPPKGWGAVESLIWDYATELNELGHDGVIINTPDPNQIIRELKSDTFDFVHVHYDVFYSLMDAIRESLSECKDCDQFSLPIH